MSKKKNKKKLKQTKTKTKQQRQDQVTEIINKLTNLGLTTENPDINNAVIQMQEFIETGNSFTGKFKLNGFKRVLHLILSNRLHIECQCNLQYNEFV